MNLFHQEAHIIAMNFLHLLGGPGGPGRARYFINRFFPIFYKIMFLVLIGVLYFNCKQELFACFHINNNEGKKCLFRFQALFFYPFGRSKDVLQTHTR